jgi:hypothetical protein
MSDPRDHALGSWLTGDIGSDFLNLLDALSAVHEVGVGKSATAEMNFGGWDVAMSGDRVSFTMEGTSRHQTYKLSEVRQALEELWTLILRHWNTRVAEVTYHYRPDLPPAWAALLSWGATYGQHPYRGRLCIPAEGPA